MAALPSSKLAALQHLPKSFNPFGSLFDTLELVQAPPRPSFIPASIYEATLSPYFPLIFGVVYFILAKTLSYCTDGKDRIQGDKWRVVLVAHNLLLAVYSGWTFVAVAPVVFGAFLKSFATDGFAGLAHIFCDSDMALWELTSFPFYAYFFYMSKFWEVLDTVIILAKGKKVGMLQSYHHTGAMLTMYAGYRTMSMPIWIFVVFNSLIHTLMYCYYTCSALKLPFPTLLKKSLTKLQITQFLVGGSLAASYLFITLPTYVPSSTPTSLAPIIFGDLSLTSVARMGSQCVVDKWQRVAVWMNVLYLIPLTYLFAAFFFKSYQKSSKAKAEAAKSKKVKSQ